MPKSGKTSPLLLIGTVALAAVLWAITFRLPMGSFWIKISLSAGTLATLAIIYGSKGRSRRPKVRLASVGLGLLSAAGLYGVFFMGKLISEQLFDFAGGQIGGIYGLGDGTAPWTIALLLLFVTGPAEELYWRGFLQRELMERLGPFRGFVLATALYAGVHLCTLNFMLIGASAVAGTFWGLQYLWKRDMTALIVSHSTWSAVIFAVFPLH